MRTSSTRLSGAFLWLLLAVVGFQWPLMAAAQETQKIAIIDVQLILRESKAVQALQGKSPGRSNLTSIIVALVGAVIVVAGTLTALLLSASSLEALRFLEPPLFFDLPLPVASFDRFHHLVELLVPLPDGLLGRHGTRRRR